MKKPKYCQGCGEVMQDRKCRECGWQYQDVIGSSGHSCAYSHNGKGCPLAGSMTETTLAGPNTKFYCTYHYKHWDDPKSAQQALYGLLSGDIKIDRTNWRDDFIDAEMEKLKKTNPELFFKPQNETEEKEYVEVCMSFMKLGLSRVLHTKKRKVYERDKKEQELLTGREVTQEQMDSADMSIYEQTNEG